MKTPQSKIFKILSSPSSSFRFIENKSQTDYSTEDAFSHTDALETTQKDLSNDFEKVWIEP